MAWRWLAAAVASPQPALLAWLPLPSVLLLLLVVVLRLLRRPLGRLGTLLRGGAWRSMRREKQQHDPPFHADGA